MPMWLDRVRRVVRRPREVERELNVPLELRLHVGLVVLEDEDAARVPPRCPPGVNESVLVDLYMWSFVSPLVV